MCSFEVLYDAYLAARKRKRKKAGTAQYEANVLACTEKLSYILATKKYVPSKFEVFYVLEPKKRLVQAPAFVDKVVLHAATDNVLYEAMTKGFIRNNHASQKGKGMHDGLDRLKWAMIDYYRKNGTAEGWVLKCDVHHFFASIDHDILKERLWDLLQHRGVDPQYYELMCTYIDTTDGLPLGYQTSQLLALMIWTSSTTSSKRSSTSGITGGTWTTSTSSPARRRSFKPSCMMLRNGWGTAGLS